MSSVAGVVKFPTHIDGFDHISMGGLPSGRTTLVCGTSGSAKTVFGTQFLGAGIAKSGANGVFVTFEEPPEAMRRNMASLGWDIAAWEKQNQWAFVDASPRPGEKLAVIGNYDLSGLMLQIRAAIERTGATRVCLDSVGALFGHFSDAAVIRRELFHIISQLNEPGLITVMTTERVEEYGAISRHGVEEFVADNVVVLRNVLEEEKRRRTIEILKFRGTMHLKGEFPFTIRPDIGIVIIPLAAITLTQKSSTTRIASGNDTLDTMCGGGFFRDSVILISGATGTGKTLLSTEFIAGGAKSGDRSLLFAFEESREQLLRNATGWGVDFDAAERAGRLKIVCAYPETQSLEDHLLAIKYQVEEYQPQRVALDSLSALERVSSLKGFREFVIGLTSFIKQREIAGLFTATTPSLFGGTSVTEQHISTITDLIVLLRYVEILGEMRRGITVLKMRGSLHDKKIREFMIDDRGMHVGKAFRNVSGILMGHPLHGRSETEEMGKLFETPNNG